MNGVLVKTDISACFLLFNFVKHKQNKVNKKSILIAFSCFLFQETDW